MTPAYLNPPPSPFPFVELKEDHQLQFFTPPNQASSSPSCPIFFNITQDQRESHDPREPQQKAEKYILHAGSSDHKALPSSSLQSSVVDTNNGHKLSYYKPDQDEDEDKRDSGAAKWMSSKMRLMQKMMSSDCSTGTNKQVRIVQKFHDHQHQNNSTETDSPSSNSNNFIRVCADCNTTKTPLWRSGPRGPKSLCNACGIRQRKARRAMAAGTTNGKVHATDTSSTKTKLQNKEKKSRTSYMAQCKKPFKLPAGHPQSGSKKLSFEDFAMSLNKNISTFQRVFPKDEEEAAILLMALSCGLVRS
ncbi:hypothetical protein F0562_011975 [Nyssa sinensis]|uniref:GATA-type domain-containing protein n=1 Tax=Nyssa sinensis TaxID=561372 RepID=A0A5J4ZT77_9ASTE|nr:hypothetical protein F0562_011975 [Nyssa sinensis]